MIDSVGYHYEDFEIGKEILTQGRTITETDIVNFSAFTGDWSEIHTNRHYAETTFFGKRIAHGMLTFSVATGLAILTRLLEGTIIAFEGINNWEFKRPVFIGDTIHVKLLCEEKNEKKLRGGVNAGQVILSVFVINQENKICQQGTWSTLIKRKS